MNFLMNIPALAKVLCLFGVIMALYRLKIPLWGGLLSVSVLTGLWFGLGLVKTFEAMGHAAISFETLFLCLVVVLLMGISNLMNATGELKRLVAALTALLGRSILSSTALPALIGLLPMPGGAVFSAPMVDAACAGGSQTPEQKAAINYWFRHIWEYWWPLYPGVILATSLFHAETLKVTLYQFPLTVAAAFGGYVFLLRPAFRVERGCAVDNGRDKRALTRDTLRESAPILVMIISIFIIEAILGKLGVKGLHLKYWPVITGVLLGIAWIIAAEKQPARKSFRMIFSSSQIEMFCLAVGIMVFKGMLDAAGAFGNIHQDLARHHLSAMFIIILLPVIAGLVMGIAVGFVGASFPIVISMLDHGVMTSDMRFAYLALVYSLGYVGMMLSPVHLCLIVTKDYFKADFPGIYRWFAAPALVTAIAGVGLFFLYRTFL